MAKKQKVLDEIEEIFKKYKISGIITMPKYGTFSLFASTSDKLTLLHHARIEIKKIELEIEKLASMELYDTISEKMETSSPKYVS